MDEHNPKCRPARYMTFQNGQKIIEVDQKRLKYNQKKEKEAKKENEKKEKQKQKQKKG